MKYYVKREKKRSNLFVKSKKINIDLDDKTYEALLEIAKMKDCSVEEAVKIVLERYSVRTMRELKKVEGLLDRLNK